MWHKQLLMMMMTEMTRMRIHGMTQGQCENMRNKRTKRIKVLHFYDGNFPCYVILSSISLAQLYNTPPRAVLYCMYPVRSYSISRTYILRFRSSSCVLVLLVLSILIYCNFLCCFTIILLLPIRRNKFKVMSFLLLLLAPLVYLGVQISSTI